MELPIIEFRGKRLDNGEWVYGNLVSDGKRYFIIYDNDITESTRYGERYIEASRYFEVDPKTIGQCTGVKDCKRTVKYSKGQPIYVGDIVIVNYGLKDRKENIINEQNCKGYLAIIKFEDGMFTHGWCEPELNGERLYVIGNIHDSPELLEVEE